MSKNIQIIGSGFSSLSAACYLAHAGHQVSIYEKNSTVGGRARQLNKNYNQINIDNDTPLKKWKTESTKEYPRFRRYPKPHH